MLLVQSYLQTHTFADLVKDHGVYAHFSKSGQKFSLSYDQIEARDTDPLSQQCRGLILATPDGTSLLPQASLISGTRLSYDAVCPGDTVVVARGMDRFFNIGQEAAKPIDWHDPKLKVCEKLDGTLTILYWDKFANQWHIATRSCPEADIPLDGWKDLTFRTLFEKALYTTNGWSFDKYTALLNKDITYCFELTGPYNQVVVKYPVNRITLIAARYTQGEEIDIFDISSLVAKNIFTIDHIEYEFLVIKQYPLSNLSDIIQWVADRNPLEYEGVVVLDSHFNRIKVKNAGYLACSRLKDKLGTSQRNCLELVLLEKEDDALPFIAPTIADELLAMKGKVRDLIKEYDTLYNGIMLGLTDPSKKDFALAIQKNKGIWHAPFYAMFDRGVENMRDFIAKNKTDGGFSNAFLDKILGLIDIK